MAGSDLSLAPPQGAPWLGPAILIFVLLLHFRLAQRPLAEAALIAACAVVGATFDSAFVAAGWIAYPSGQWHASLAPYWIVGMWMLFGTTLNVSLRWLKGRPMLAAAIGAIAGPASYIAGQKLGGLEFLQFVPAIVGLAVGWAVALPFVAWIADELDGVSGQEARA